MAFTNKRYRAHTRPISAFDPAFPDDVIEAEYAPNRAEDIDLGEYEGVDLNTLDEESEQAKALDLLSINTLEAVLTDWSYFQDDEETKRPIDRTNIVELPIIVRIALWMKLSEDLAELRKGPKGELKPSSEA